MSVHNQIKSRIMANISYRQQSHFRFVRQYLVYFEGKWYVAVFVHYEDDQFNVGAGSDWWEFYDCSMGELLDSDRNSRRIQQLLDALPKAERFSRLHCIDGKRYNFEKARCILKEENAVVGQLIRRGSLTESQIESYLSCLDSFSALGSETEKQLNHEMSKFVAVLTRKEKRRSVFRIF